MKRFVTQGRDLFLWEPEGVYAAPLDVSHHIFDVMRLGAGDVLEIVDTYGHVVTARIRKDGSVSCTGAGLLSRIERPFDVVLLMPLIKWPRFEWALEKASELGVQRIIPLECERSVVRVDDWPKKRDRLQKIIVEAGRQSCNPCFPELGDPVRLFGLREVWSGPVYFAHPGPYAQLRSLVSAFRGATGFAAGPEGGFTPAEVEYLRGAGTAVSLGPTILRAETACVAFASLLSY